MTCARCTGDNAACRHRFQCCDRLRWICEVHACTWTQIALSIHKPWPESWWWVKLSVVFLCNAFFFFLAVLHHCLSFLFRLAEYAVALWSGGCSMSIYTVTILRLCINRTWQWMISCIWCYHSRGLPYYSRPILLLVANWSLLAGLRCDLRWRLHADLVTCRPTARHYRCCCCCYDS